MDLFFRDSPEYISSKKPFFFYPTVQHFLYNGNINDTLEKCISNLTPKLKIGLQFCQ